MKQSNTQISKGPALQWLAHFLAQYNSQCYSKYVYLDQGGEISNHPDIWNLFEKKGYHILHTGTNNLHKNGPVEQGHYTLANAICTLLVSAPWHKILVLCLLPSSLVSNTFPERSASQSQVSQVTSKQEDFLNICTFGCCARVCPTGYCLAKLKLILKKVSSLHMSPTPIKTSCGMTLRPPESRLLPMLALMKAQMTCQS